MKKELLAISFAAFTLLGAGCKTDNYDLPTAPDHRNASYIINGKVTKLTNGKAEEKIPDSSGTIKTQIFDDNFKADINGDGKDDVLMFLTQNTGGSGTFFYAAAALKTDDGYIGTNAILLGDRIAPQNINFRNGTIEVNYADRKPSDSFAVPPSVGVTKYLKYSDGQLKETALTSNTVNKIDLSNKNLTKVPMSIFSNTKADELDLSNNDLTGAIPAEIRKLSNLKRLDLHNNKMTGLPAELGQLSKLEYLDVSNNQLTGLPYELGNLKNLKTFKVSGNNYSTQDLAIIKSKLPNTEFIIK